MIYKQSLNPTCNISGRILSGIITAIVGLSLLGQEPTEIVPIPKSTLTKPFEITLVYEMTDCGGQLISVTGINGQPPFFWYEVDAQGKYLNTWVNPKLSQLKDETWYIVADAWEHLDTIYISFSKDFDLVSLAPNPFREAFVISYKTGIAVEVVVELFDLYGKPIEAFIMMLKPGTESYRFEPHGLSKGTYLLQLSSPCFCETLKIVYMGD